jgi:predicted phosphodiesterase
LVKEANLVLHAGDFVCQGAYDDLVRLCMDSKCELWAIQGNNPIQKAPQIQKAVQIRDFSRNEKGDSLPTQKADERFGIKIGLMHDANKGLYDFSESAAADNAATMVLPSGAKGVDVLVFGHLHEPIIVWNKNTQGKRRLLVCPGPGGKEALSHKCSPSPTVALLDIERRNISRAEIIRIVWP